MQEKAKEMRQNSTKAEDLLWQLLRRDATNYHFRRQHIIGKFIVDFVCLEKKLVVEVDGDVHDCQKESDQERSSFLEQKGFKIIRFKNEKVIENGMLVVAEINETLKALSFGEGLGGVDSIKVFTTRPETIFGATFIARHGAADHFTGEYAINPVSQEKIPIWEAEYVMGDVGTGAIMGVPAHDERDLAFAQKHNLAIRNVVIPRLIDTRNPHVPGKKIVFRNAIIAVVRNPKTGKFLCLKWKKQPWTTFVMGGVEEGEDPVLAAIREIKEETGYQKVKLVKILGEAQSEFFAAHKDVNRIAHTYSILFDLEDDKKEEISEEEKNIHEMVWLPLAELTSEKMTHSEMPLILDGMKIDRQIYTGIGVLTNSDQFDGKNSEEVRDEIIKLVDGEKQTIYKLRDWVFSRQRYWGEPIPLVFCQKCQEWVPVPEKDLPVKLPVVKKYQPTDNGESPLALVEKWVKVKCPKCSGTARRETDVMPNWAGSSWYYVAYCVSENLNSQLSISKQFSSSKIQKKLNRWLPVDWYNGGTEHTTLHLLYSRFWHKVLNDLKLVPGQEPYQKRTSHGFILAHDGEKMSKSRGNVVNPDDIVRRFGADTLRVYEMFMGPFDQAIAWNEDGLVGSRRFLERVWKIVQSARLAVGQVKLKTKNKIQEENLQSLINQTIKKVSDDIEVMKFNTAISSLMILLNSLEKESTISVATIKIFLKLLSPFAPHITDELWQNLGEKKSIHLAPWPRELKVQSASRRIKVKIVVQINGKTRDVFEAENGLGEKELTQLAISRPKVKMWLKDKPVRKTIFIPNRLINFVIDNN
ncbi:MAG: DUF559 domain-containing protein [Candidatus Vogelbacteria bacterium]